MFIFIEANYGGVYNIENIRTVCEQDEFKPLEVVSYDRSGKDKTGIWMSDTVKECMAREFQRILADGLLHFAKEFVSTQKPTEVQRTFREQLAHYREELVKPHDEAIGITKKKITGKSASLRDDLCISAQIALYFSGKKRMEAKFRADCDAYGWRM